MWDVFISHCGEDKPAARLLAKVLGSKGVEVWFDEEILVVGDSIRESIDRGLRNSRFGVVILSDRFFQKRWPQNELSALFAMEKQADTKIIPVRHNLSIEALKRASPLLADRVSISMDAGAEEVATRIVRAILRKGGTGHQITSPDGTELVILPIRPRFGYAVGIGRTPITNSQYRRYVEATGAPEPVGKHLQLSAISGNEAREDRRRNRMRWSGPFNPWQSAIFCDPEFPVVCISYSDAIDYCRWVTQLTRLKLGAARVALPTPALWEFATYGRVDPPKWWVRESLGLQQCHHLATSPTRVDADGQRTNPLGISDAFGNVWEWTRIVHFGHRDPHLYFADEEPTVYGGGFLDNVTQVSLSLSAIHLEDYASTRHSDLGFRISAAVPLLLLPQHVQDKLALSEEIELLDFDTGLSDTAIILP
jgi:hypothetical protein